MGPDLRQERRSRVGMISDDELASYADEALRQFELDPLSGRLDAELVSTVARYLRLSLQRINELPSHDPLWVNTNRRPTLFKAQEWFRARLADDPSDLEARWVVISYTLAWCQYGAEELLAPLVRENVVHVRWLVGASEWLTSTSGPDQTDPLRTVLRSSVDESALRRLADAGNEDERRAARVALAVLDGASLADAIAAHRPTS